MNNKIIEEWVSKKKYNQDRLNKINKRIKKYLKQKSHFEFRLRMISEYEKGIRRPVKE